jgi:RHS repeat-associated protein
VTTFLHSGLKDATAQTSTAQSLTATRVYDAFGMVVSSTGAWKGPFGYAGEHGYQEDATGLQLLGHRYYDPSTGRFLTRDPAKDGSNWYGYCGNEPTTLADPEGLDAIGEKAGDIATDDVTHGRRKNQKDCKEWVKDVYRRAGDPDMPDGVANTWEDGLRKRKDTWEEVTDGSQQKGDVIVTRRKRGKHGHVMIVGSDAVYDASWEPNGGGHGPKERQKLKTKYKDKIRPNDGKITVWRHKDKNVGNKENKPIKK